MKKFIFILGGARSGKSRYAVELAKGFSKKVVFIATAAPLDREMNRRIKLHNFQGRSIGRQSKKAGILSLLYPCLPVNMK